MTPTKIPMGPYYWGLGASLLTLLTGGWLILAPFALGYQAGNTGSWTDMTQNDVWAGCGVVLVSLAGLVFFARALAGALRAAGILRARPRPKAQPQPAAAAPAAAPSTPPSRPELEQTLALLAEALASDLQERRKGETKVGTEHVAGPATIGRER